MNKYEKELLVLKEEYQTRYAEYKNGMNKLRSDAQRACNVYNGHIGVINSERHSLREELRALYDFLGKLGDVGIGITVFDYVIEVPESINLEQDVCGNISDIDRNTHGLRDATTFVIAPAIFLAEKAVGGLLKRSRDKKTLLEQTGFAENEYTKWEKQLGDANQLVEFYKTAGEIADIYRGIVAMVRDTIKQTIIPELDGVAAFLAAFAIKEAVIFGEDPDEAVALGIEQFNGTPYEQHYIFVKNTFEYYQLIKTFFTEPILTRIVSDREITLQEKCEFKKKTAEIESKGKQIVNMASFGG